MGEIAAEHEEIITKTVEIADDQGVDGKLFHLHPDAGSFGAATDASDDMGSGDGNMAAGEDECLHRWELAVHAIDVFLERFNVLFPEVGYAHLCLLFRVTGEGGADGEEPVLDLTELAVDGG